MGYKPRHKMLSRDDLLEKVNQGLSVKQISDQTEGITLNQIRSLVEEYDLESCLHDRSHYKWTDDEIDQLISEWLTEPQPSIEDVAKIHKWSVGAISTRIKYLIKSGRLAPCTKPHNKSKKWKFEEIDRLKKLVEQGKDWSDIASTLDRSESSIKTKFQKEQRRAAKKSKDDVVEIMISGSGLNTCIKIPRGKVNIAIPSFGWETTVSGSK